MYIPIIAAHRIWDFLKISNDSVLAATQWSLGLTLLTSLILSYIMIRFKGKRPVDNAVVLREVAFVLVLGRVFFAFMTGDPLNIWAFVIYTFLGLTVAALLYLTIREQWFPPPIIDTEDQVEIKALRHEVQELKEKSDGHEEI